VIDLLLPPSENSHLQGDLVAASGWGEIPTTGHDEVCTVTEECMSGMD